MGSLEEDYRDRYKEMRYARLSGLSSDQTIAMGFSTTFICAFPLYPIQSWAGKTYNNCQQNLTPS